MRIGRWILVGSLVSVVGIYLAYAVTTSRHGLNYSNQESLNATIDRLDRVIPPTRAGHPDGSAIFCGQLSVASGNTFLGPNFQDGTNLGEGFASDAGGAICNALDSNVEATADAPLFKNFDVYVTGMYCRAVADDGTTGSGANGVVFNLRINALPVSPALTCTVPTGGIDCYAAYDTDATLAKISANTPADILATDTEDLSAMDGWCRVFFTLP